MVWSTLVGNVMAILRVSRVYLSPHPFSSSPKLGHAMSGEPVIGVLNGTPLKTIVDFCMFSQIHP